MRDPVCDQALTVMRAEWTQGRWCDCPAKGDETVSAHGGECAWRAGLEALEHGLSVYLDRGVSGDERQPDGRLSQIAALAKDATENPNPSEHERALWLIRDLCGDERLLREAAEEALAGDERQQAQDARPDRLDETLREPVAELFEQKPHKRTAVGGAARVAVPEGMADVTYVSSVAVAARAPEDGQ